MIVLLADDHTLLRHGLRAILEKERDVQRVEEASNGREAVDIARRTPHPNVIVIGIGIPSLNSIDATREIVAENRNVKIIGLSPHSERSAVYAMFAAGATGYLLKETTASEFLFAIRAVTQNKTYVSPAVAEDVALGTRSLAQSAPKALSVREREVLQLLAEGKTSKEIARALHLSVPTVETHRRQITSKLGIHTIAQLTKYAVREGLTALEH
jgi:DNA-binding NarL/FixJ family response regulator